MNAAHPCRWVHLPFQPVFQVSDLCEVILPASDRKRIGQRNGGHGGFGTLLPFLPLTLLLLWRHVSYSMLQQPANNQNVTTIVAEYQNHRLCSRPHSHESLVFSYFWDSYFLSYGEFKMREMKLRLQVLRPASGHSRAVRV